MDKIEELRNILRRLPDTYRSGDIEDYLDHYATDMTSCFEGVISTYGAACNFIRSAFKGGGKTLELSVGDRSQILFSETADAATICYPWRETFRYPDGHVTDTEYFQTEVWFCRNDQWKIVHVHLTVIEEHVVSISTSENRRGYPASGETPDCCKPRP